MLKYIPHISIYMNNKGAGAIVYIILGLVGLAVALGQIAITFNLYDVPEIPAFDTIFAVLLIIYGIHSIVNGNEMAMFK